jgi:hypothetical protein
MGNGAGGVTVVRGPRWYGTLVVETGRAGLPVVGRSSMVGDSAGEAGLPYGGMRYTVSGLRLP